MKEDFILSSFLQLTFEGEDLEDTMLVFDVTKKEAEDLLWFDSRKKTFKIILFFLTRFFQPFEHQLT